MNEATMNTLAGWENFYVIVASSAGALIDLHRFASITKQHADLVCTQGTAPNS